MDTSEAFGPWFSNTGDQSFIVGAARDPTRWSNWADVVIMVGNNFNRKQMCNFIKLRFIPLPVKKV